MEVFERIDIPETAITRRVHVHKPIHIWIKMQLALDERKRGDKPTLQHVYLNLIRKGLELQQAGMPLSDPYYEQGFDGHLVQVPIDEYERVADLAERFNCTSEHVLLALIELGYNHFSN